MLARLCGTCGALTAEPARLCAGCGQPTKRRRRGSTHAYRKQRAITLANATACALCGRPFTADDPAETDHIVAHADGGTHAASNLRAAHRSCNRRRGRGSGRPERVF